MASGGCRKVWLGGQAREGALEAESLEQCWNKVPGKEEKTQRSLHLKQWLRNTRLRGHPEL